MIAARKPRSDWHPLLRGVRIGERLSAGHEITTAWLRATFEVSPATAKRDAAIIATLQDCDADRPPPGSPVRIRRRA